MNLYEKCKADIKLNKFNCDNTDDLSKIINSFDENGRTLLHWAAFYGNNDALTSLLNNGANVLLMSENDECFQAIHFSAVNNHIDCMQTLLDFGVSIESCDMFRRTPLCISAFYGRIVASVFLLSKKANIGHQDMNGNNVLHFAALSGNCDLCQIFLYSGIDIHVKNDFGETAVHVASKRGSKRLLKSLLSHNPELLHDPDHKGINPLGHAKFNRNTVGLKFLQEELRKSRKINFKLKITDFMYGRGGSRLALMFLVVMVFFFAVPIYVSNILFLTYSDWPILNCLLICDLMILMLCLYAVKSIEPFYLPRFTKEYDDTLKNISSIKFNEADILKLFGRLCHTCRTVRLLRSSHCNICKRCVREKDHHCPYVFNCIGYRNRQYFLGFLLSVWFAMSLGLGFWFILYFQYEYKFAIYECLGFGLLAFYYLFVNATLVATLLGAVRNITTNEIVKWNKYGYEYLRNDDGQFVNSFDKGPLVNMLAFFRIVVEFRNINTDTIEV